MHRLVEFVRFITQDIVDLESKAWLKVAIRSHCRHFFPDQSSRNINIAIRTVCNF
jgi:hypothetical protein